MRKLRVLFVFLSGLFLSVHQLHAQAASFTTSADRTTVGLADRFQVQFTVSGGKLQGVGGLKLPDLNTDFSVVMGPSTSQSMQVINGTVSTSLAWVYVLQPRRQGVITIGSASITVEGKTLTTSPLKIKVVAGGSSPQQTPSRDSEAPDLSRLDLDAKFFLRAIPSRQSIYVGEPVRVDFKIYSRIPFGIQSMIRKPGTTGFWVEELERKNERPEFEVVNGVRYQVFQVSSLVFYPTKPGRSIIEAIEAECTIQVMQRRKTGDPRLDQFFDDPFFDVPRDIQVTRRSNTVTLDVKPLPEAGKPAHFSGAVGSYTMRTYINKTTLTTSQACTLKVALEGKGNIKFLEEPVLRLSSGLEKYPPNVIENIDRTGTTISGVKVFEYFLISRFPGSRTVEPVEFCFFNPESRKYETLTSPGYSLTFSQGTEAAPDRPSGPGPRRDLVSLPEHPSSLTRVEDRPSGWLAILAAITLPALLGIGGTVIKRRYDKTHADVPALNRRRAEKTARKHLAASERFLKSGSVEDFSRELDRAVWGYMRHKFTITTAELSAAMVLAILSDRQSSEELKAMTASLLAEIDFLRFAPPEDRKTRMRELLQSALDCIVRIEQETMH